MATKKELEARIAALEAEVAALRAQRPIPSTTPGMWPAVPNRWPPQWWRHYGVGQMRAPVEVQWTFHANANTAIRDLNRHLRQSPAVGAR